MDREIVGGTGREGMGSGWKARVGTVVREERGVWHGGT